MYDSHLNNWLLVGDLLSFYVLQSPGDRIAGHYRTLVSIDMFLYSFPQTLIIKS